MVKKRNMLLNRHNHENGGGATTSLQANRRGPGTKMRKLREKTGNERERTDREHKVYT
jgi:hypothetical protein